MAHTVFVVYGRDVAAYEELSKFLRSLQINHITFEAVAATLPQPPIIVDVVLNGIERADAVIVLLTPDELSIHFDSESGAYLGDTAPDHARWQARPNVIFEAGVAIGAQRGNTILATIGADVSLFSDVAGMHVVELDKSYAKRHLYNQLKRFFPDLIETDAHWETSPDSGDFIGCRRVRWTPFDEVSALAKALDAETVFDDESESVLDVVRTTVFRSRTTMWRNRMPWEFCLSMEKIYHRSVVDQTYWTLFVQGFFRPADDEQFFKGEGNTWRQGAPYSIFAERGIRLIERLKAIGRRPAAGKSR